MVKEKIVQPVFNDIFNHIMPPVVGQELCETGKIPISQWFTIHIFQNLYGTGFILIIKFVPQLFVKGIIHIILQHFFSEISTTALVTQYIADTGALLSDLFAIIIAAKGSRAQVT